MSNMSFDPSSLGNPYVGEDGQDDVMTPEVVGPPQYGSPHMATAQGRLTSLKEHPLRPNALPEGHPAAISSDYGMDARGLQRHALETSHHGMPSGEPTVGDDVDHTAADPIEDDETDLPEIDATASAVELAKEENVNLADVEGSGVNGRITKPDVEDYIEDRDEGADNESDES